MTRNKEEDGTSIVSLSSDSDSDSSDEDETFDDDLVFVGVKLHGHKFSTDATNTGSTLGGKVKKEEEEDDDSFGSATTVGSKNKVKQEDDAEADVKPSVNALEPARLSSPPPAAQSNTLRNRLNCRIIEESGEKFKNLPQEIKLVILGCLDEDPHSVLCLMMVCKSWHHMLSKGPQAEQDWERRCRLMGATGRAPECITWRATFIKRLKETCLSCLKSSTAAFGHLLDGQPDWLIVCRKCQNLPGLWQTISEKEARRRNPRGVKSLPFLAAKNPNWRPPIIDASGNPTSKKKNNNTSIEYLKLYLARAVGDPFDGRMKGSYKKKCKAFRKLRDGDLARQPEMQTGLLTILEYLDEANRGKRFLSMRLMNMASALATQNPQIRHKHSLKETYMDAVLYLEKVRIFETQLDAHKVAYADLWTYALEDTVEKLLEGNQRSWGDKIITATATWQDSERHLEWRQADMSTTLSEGQRERLRGRAMTLKEKQVAVSQALKNQTPPGDPVLLLMYNQIRSKRNKGEEPRKQKNGAKLRRSKRLQKIPPDIADYRIAPNDDDNICQGGCRQQKASRCEHKSCGTCCPGPCARHNIKRKIDLYSAKKETPEER